MWPSLIALPYEVLLLYHALVWGQRKQRSQSSPFRVLQAYAGDPSLCNT